MPFYSTGNPLSPLVTPFIYWCALLYLCKQGLSRTVAGLTLRYTHVFHHVSFHDRDFSLALFFTFQPLSSNDPNIAIFFIDISWPASKFQASQIFERIRISYLTMFLVKAANDLSRSTYETTSIATRFIKFEKFTMCSAQKY